jgi:acyl-CoA hydrolase
VEVAGLIRDGDCLQTGIGAIPAAVLAALQDKRDLGLHGGLFDAGMLALIDAGVITGERKGRDKGVHIACSVLGSAALLDRLSERTDVLLKGANYTHEASVISQIDNFVSINSAVQVDLLGQLNGEFAGNRQISGTGGSVDFMRAARGSRGGRSIVAMPATARGGSLSRIVARVDMVTALRTDIDIVVTQYGVAQLRDQPLAERARRLIAIAAPEFRDKLSAGIA